MSLDAVETKLKSNLSKFRGLNARVKFDCEKEGVLFLDAKASPPTLSREGGETDCTIRITTENLNKLIEGNLNPTLAYTTGKLKVQGSMGVALKMSALLEE